LNITKKKTALVALVLLALIATVIAGVVIWHLTTKITVAEPFTVVSDLPTELPELYSGIPYSYTINVTNKGGQLLNATLTYTVVAPENVTYKITPDSGTSLAVEAGNTVTFDITITVHLIGDTTLPAELTIDWSVERVVP
jgi:uncharacterized protein YxeA